MPSASWPRRATSASAAPGLFDPSLRRGSLAERHRCGRVGVAGRPCALHTDRSVRCREHAVLPACSREGSAASAFSHQFLLAVQELQQVGGRTTKVRSR